MSEYDAMRYFAWHLLRAKDYETLYALVEDRQWYERRLAGDFAGKAYSDDLNLAMSGAEAQGLSGVSNLIGYSLQLNSLSSF